MTADAELVQKELSLLVPADFKKNVSETYRANGCFREYFYGAEEDAIKT